MHFSRRFTIAQKLNTLPWVAHAVRPLYDQDGELIAYAELFEGEDLLSLPVEMFRHVMEGVNPDDPRQLAAFMSEFGIIGSRTYRGNELTSRRPRERECIINRLLELESVEDARRVEERYRLYASVTGGHDAWVRPSEAMLQWYLSLRRSLESAGYRAKAPGDLNPGDVRYLVLVTAQEARRAFDCLFEAGCVAQVLALPEEKRGVKWAGDVEGAVLEGRIRSSDEYLNSCLKPLSPKIGFVASSDPSLVIDPATPASYEMLDESIADVQGEIGGLEEAIAIQIYNFSLEASNCRICLYCEHPFVEKYSPDRKGKPRSTSDYCSDKCQKAAKAKRSREKEKRERIRKMCEAAKSSEEKAERR